MGLDISAIGKPILVVSGEDLPEKYECLWECMEDLQVDNPRVSFEVLTPNRHYPKQSESFIDGVYQHMGHCDVDFCVAYSGWSNIREILCKAIGYTPLTVEEARQKWTDFGERDAHSVNCNPHQWRCWYEGDGHLSLLCNFSDCEGIINNESCCKIHEDLKDIVVTDEYYGKKIEDLKTMVEWCVNNDGVLSFH